MRFFKHEVVISGLMVVIVILLIGVMSLLITIFIRQSELNLEHEAITEEMIRLQIRNVELSNKIDVGLDDLEGRLREARDDIQDWWSIDSRNLILRVDRLESDHDNEERTDID